MEFFGTVVDWSKRKRRETWSVFPNRLEFLFDLAPRLTAEDIGK
jgi:hypothetical protein